MGNHHTITSIVRGGMIWLCMCHSSCPLFKFYRLVNSYIGKAGRTGYTFRAGSHASGWFGEKSAHVSLVVSVGGEVCFGSCPVLQLVSLTDPAEPPASLVPVFTALLCYSGLSQACFCCQVIKDTFVFTDVHKDFWEKM